MYQAQQAILWIRARSDQAVERGALSLALDDANGFRPQRSWNNMYICSVMCRMLKNEHTGCLKARAGEQSLLKMSVGYQLFGIPIPNRHQLGILCFSPNVFAILLALSILTNV